MRVEILRSLPELYAFDEWRTMPTPPFASWAYLIAWLSHAPDTVEPYVVVLRDGEQVVGVAPWVRYRTPWGRVLSGAGEVAHDPVVRAPDALPALVEALGQRRGDWDLLRLSLEAGDLPLALRRLGVTTLAEVEWQHRSRVRFEGDWEAYWADRSCHFQGNLRRWRRLNEHPHRFLTTSELDIDASLDALFQLHAERHPMTPRSSYSITRSLAHEAERHGRLCLFVLEIDGTYAAIDLAVRSGDTAYGLMKAYLPDYASLGAGMRLTLWGFETMYRAGVRLIDCGPGVHEWKQHLRTEVLGTRLVQVAVRPAAIALLDWKAIGRSCLQQLPPVQRFYRMLRQAPSTLLKGGTS